MKAILIDPKAKQVMQINYNGDYKTIYEHLSFQNAEGMTHKPRAFDVVRTPTGGDGIYVDDEGLYAPAEDKHWFSITYKEQDMLLVNRSLVIGCDEEGNSTDCASTVEDIRQRIKWGIPAKWSMVSA
tara:strand:+ start:411 stop:791 length:381 start_codon:yes stop_codon:yes gene_type:complete